MKNEYEMWVHAHSKSLDCSLCSAAYAAGEKAGYERATFNCELRHSKDFFFKEGYAQAREDAAEIAVDIPSQQYETIGDALEDVAERIRDMEPEPKAAGK